MRSSASVEVLVPWRGGCSHREAALRWVRGRYRWPVTVAEALAGEWCKAAAVMPAVEASTADVLVIADADVWTDGVVEAVAAVECGEPWAVPHTRVLRLTEACSARVMSGDPEGLEVAEPFYRGVMGGGVTVLPRETCLRVPLDHRFTGWGQEDVAWGYALTTLAGTRWRGSADLLHLWHPPQPRMTRRYGNPHGVALFNRYRRAVNDPAAMGALIEEARCSLIC